MAKHYLDSNGLLYFWGLLKNWVNSQGFLKSSNITSKADKVTGATNGNFAGLDANGNLVDSGHKHSDYLTSHQDISGKVDKTTTVNGHALSGNVIVTKSDVGLENVTNEAQVKRTEMGVANGVATLNSSGKVPSEQLPSYVDDVIEVYARAGQTPLSSTWFATDAAGTNVVTPETGKIYVLMADSGDYAAESQFRWGGSAYVKMADGGVSPITNVEIDAIVIS